MPYRVSISEVALRQLDALSARERSIVESGIAQRLFSQPALITKAIKHLRPNPFAAFELRIGDFRMLYNVDEGIAGVTILLVGLKVGDKLIVEGEEFHGDESHPAP